MRDFSTFLDMKNQRRCEYCHFYSRIGYSMDGLCSLLNVTVSAYDWCNDFMSDYLSVSDDEIS